MQYDCHHGARPLAQLQPGERVRLCTKNDNDWSVTGRIVEQRPDRDGATSWPRIKAPDPLSRRSAVPPICSELTPPSERVNTADASSRPADEPVTSSQQPDGLRRRPEGLSRRPDSSGTAARQQHNSGTATAGRSERTTGASARWRRGSRVPGT